MRKDRPCPECGHPLAENAPDGVCPVCSLQNTLKSVAPGPRTPAGGADVIPALTLGLPGLPRFGDYELVELLARGGMGVVYKARQLSLHRTVALKMIQAGALASPAEVKRFHAEAQAVAQLQHPNIVAVHEIGEHEGQHYFSMDYVAGRTLAEVVREGPLPAARAATYVQVIAAAVHYAHEHGIIHRDLKPANVIIDEHDQPRITDFGLAKRLHDSALSSPGSALTVSGQVLGSPNYLPPEQAEPERGALGPTSDVYALGAILYHLLTGRPPFQAESLTTLLRQVLEADPVTPRSLNPGIPRDVETVCLKCLEKEPPRRYPTARALVEDLGRFLKGEPVRARPLGGCGKIWRQCRRRPVLVGLAGTLTLVLVLGVIGIAWQWGRAERERDSALRQVYAGDMKVAQFSMEQGNLGGAQGLLNKQRPQKRSDRDLRGWEWRYLWACCRGDERLTLVRQSGGFLHLALSPDGQRLAVRQDGGNIEMWDWRGAHHLGTLTNQGWPQAMAFSPDGTLLASANRDRRGSAVVSFWDVATQRIGRDLPQPSGGVTSLAFSPDGRLMAAFHVNPLCSLWDLPAGRLITNYAVGQSVNADMRIPVFTPDGAKLVLGDCNGSYGLLHLIDLHSGAVRPIQAAAESINALAVSPDGQWIASAGGYSDGIIRLWDASSLAHKGDLKGHRSWVKKLVFSADNQRLFSASADQTIRVWRLQDRKELRQWRGHTAAVTGLALSPDGKSMLSCARDGSIRVWDTLSPPRAPPTLVLPIEVGPYGAPFTADSRRLITASPTAPVTVWDVGTGQEVDRIPALGTNQYSVALSPDERWLATGSRNGVIQVWDMRARAVAARFQASRKGTAVYALRFLIQDQSLLSWAVVPREEVELKRWQAGSWQEIPVGPADVRTCYGFAQSPDGRRLALAYAGGPVRLWDTASGRLEASFGTAAKLSPAFSPDGRLLAAPIGNRALIWEISSRRPSAALELTANLVVAVAFSPEGNRLATGSDVGGNLQPAVEIWDFVAQRSLLSLPSGNKFASWIEFSPNGNTLLALSFHGLAELWHAPSWEEIEAAGKAEAAP